MKNLERIERLEERVKDLEQRLTPTWAQGEYKPSEPEPQHKTTRQWLEELPGGYRERALSQMYDSEAHTVCKSLHGAICVFTSWSNTNEGYDFWNEVYRNYHNGTPLPLLPAEQYNAGFWWNNVDNLNLPDGSYIYVGIASKTWQKFRRPQRSSQPHTLTEVKEYTVGKFYHLDGDKNHYGNYGLCAKVEKDVILMRAINVSGVIAMSVTLARHDDNDIVEVTPIS